MKYIIDVRRSRPVQRFKTVEDMINAVDDYCAKEKGKGWFNETFGTSLINLVESEEIPMDF